MKRHNKAGAAKLTVTIHIWRPQMETYLEKRDVAKNQARFYRMMVLPNLFGSWTLYREWGRIGQGGHVRMDWFDREDEAVTALIELEAIRRRRGYWVEPQQLTML